MRSILSALVAVVAISTTSAAADKPNFSGEWKMNVARSTFGSTPPLTSYTRKVTHAEPSLTVQDDQRGGVLGDVTFTIKYTTDGKKTTYDLNGLGMEATAKWDGDAMVTTSADTAGFGVTTRARWTLSGDGNTLTLVFHADSPAGAQDVTYVFDRQ
jgi:hypothetical protein